MPRSRTCLSLLAFSGRCETLPCAFRLAWPLACSHSPCLAGFLCVHVVWPRSFPPAHPGRDQAGSMPFKTALCLQDFLTFSALAGYRLSRFPDFLCSRKIGTCMCGPACHAHCRGHTIKLKIPINLSPRIQEGGFQRPCWIRLLDAGRG